MGSVLLAVLVAASADANVALDTRVRTLMHTQVTLALPSDVSVEVREAAFVEGFVVFEGITKAPSFSVRRKVSRWCAPSARRRCG
jgi:hypothetical protein